MNLGEEIGDAPLEETFCGSTTHKPGEVMIVPDAWSDIRFQTNPLVIGPIGLRFYAGAPVTSAEGIALGVLSVIDTLPRRLSQAQIRMLTALARQVRSLAEVARSQSEIKALQARAEALQRNEAYFRHLTEYSMDMITILEPNGTIRFESRSIERILGHSPAHYRGRNAFEFVHPDDLPVVAEAFAKAMETRGNTPLLRFRFRHRDGSYRLLEGSGNNLVDDPIVRGMVFNSQDITERVNLQRDVERSRAEKEETIAMLTGGVAHDFNNILTSIQGNAELTLAKVAEGSDASRYLENIRSSTARAADLTRQLLAFSRRVVLQPRPVNFDKWLRNLEPRLKEMLNPEIELLIVSNGDCHVWEDPTQLEQVILQLASNAREAMTMGGVFLLQAAPVVFGPEERAPEGLDGEARYVRLTVADQGCGMDSNTLSRIFDPYFTTKSGNHSGLGLSMCRGIMEQSGGHMTVESYPGRGTVFQLYLPAHDEVVEEELPPAPEAPAPSGVPTILFVDDEPMLREIGETILAESGYQVIVAEDGPSALARLAELGNAKIDLLLTDVVMPGMTGVQLAEEVMRMRPHIHVLLASGYTRDALSQYGGLPAGVAFLPKPYSLSALLDKVGEVLAA